MSDTIGRITVPSVINSGQTFPLTTQYPFGFSVERPVIVHRFGSLDAKQEQRYYVGIGPRKFQFKRPNLGWSEANQLKAFWENMQGPWKAFTYTVPNPDGTTSSVLVTFEQAPISFEYLRNAVQVGLNLIEVVDPTAAPTYTISSTCVRFPSTALSTALLSEVQQIVPLIHIRARESAVADIYLSDRRVTVGGQLYLPRLIGIGEPGSDVLISQDIKGTSDNVRFAFGNGDRVMTRLANDTDLKYAEIDLCLFHVNSGILLQLWAGVIQNFTSDGTPVFPVTCSDGFFQIMNQYPERQVSRQCWKTYNDGVNCPWATKGRSSSAVTAAGGDPGSCDYYLESANGCQVHGMAPYFGGHQADPQGVVIKDDSTGFLGFGRNTVTATSIVSDTIWGLALPEIWCNSGGNPIFAFMANALMVAYRVISFADVAYQYQANTAEYCDKSHAAYYGRAGAPLTTQMHSVGCSSLSQALRIAATRTREELGGVTPAEWRDARTAAWQTTLLGLGNEVGQVVSMTHPDIPGVHGTCNVSGSTATWVSGDPWTYAGTATGDTELLNKEILIGGSQVTITAVASDGSTITTSPAPPSGTGLAFQVVTMCFRIQRWSLKKDWSVQIEAQTVTASMYDLDVGPKPMDVVPAPMPALFYQIPLGPVWAPYQVQASSSDALFPGEWTFDSDQEYTTLADGSALASLILTGKLPVNEFSATGAGAPGIGSISQSTTGGSLPADITLWAGVCAIDSNGVPSVPSNIAFIGTGTASGGTFTLDDITWPAVAGLASYVL